MQPATAAAFVLSFVQQSQSTVPYSATTVTVYTALGGLPNPADPGSYSLVTAYNSSLNDGRAGQLAAAIYRPASMCPVTNQSLASGCQVVMAAVTSDSSQQVFQLQSMVTATPLTAGKTVIGVASTTTTTYYQMPVPAGVVGTIVLSLLTSAPVLLSCSYRIIRPTFVISDWTANVTAADSSTTVNISWNAPLLNAINGVSPAADTCYCSLTSASAGFTLSYSFTATPGPSPPAPSPSSTGLSSGLLFVAIFVPVVVAVVAVLVMVLLCRRYGSCGCRGMLSKGLASPRKSEAPRAGGGGASMETEQSERGESGAPMSEPQPVGIIRPRVNQSSLLSSRALHSDA